MRWEKRTINGGAVYYSFIYWDNRSKKRIRLKKSEVPAGIDTDQKAEDFCRRKEAELTVLSMKAKRQLEWKQRYYDFAELLEIYQIKRKSEAPNSWQTDIYYLEQYVFRYLLEIAKSNNLNDWENHLENLRDWLERDANLIKQKRQTLKLSYSTKNACIKSLNRFFQTMVRLQKMKGPAPKCSMFPKHQLNKKGIEAYIPENEFTIVHAKLKELDSNVADFYLVLINTGLRLNEALGLALSHIFKGIPTESNLRKMLSKFNIDSHVHIILDSQPVDSIYIKDDAGVVKRKPLKHRKRIEPRNNRIIPVSSITASKILASRFNLQSINYKNKTNGQDRSNYLLFDGLNKNKVSTTIRMAYSLLNLSAKSPHDCRHTYCTNLIAQTEGHHFLAKYVLGHTDITTTENYLHLWAVIQQKLTQDQQIEDTIELPEYP